MELTQSLHEWLETMIEDAFAFNSQKLLERIKRMEQKLKEAA